MKAQHPESLQAFDLISQGAQERLQERIAGANGDIALVRREIQSELERLDQKEAHQTNDALDTHQADRAFYVGQLTYLNVVQQVVAEQEQPKAQGLWARFRSPFRRAEANR